MLTSYSLGSYRASEGAMLAVGRFYRGNGTKRGCLYLHGSGQTAPFVDSATSGHLGRATALADGGIPVLSADLGVPTVLTGTNSGPANFGNDNAITSMGSAKTFLQTAPANGLFGSGVGAKTDKFVIFGTSMGALGALNYLISLANPSSVCAAVGLCIPALDLDDIYQNNKGSNRAAIGAAYGVTFPTAIPNLATHSPAAYSGANLAKLSMPIQLWPASDDPTASTTAACTTWAATVGNNVTVSNLGAVGHDPTSLTGAAVLSFLGQYV